MSSTEAKQAMKAHTLLTFVTIAILSAALVSAEGLEPPHQFYGEIYINGEPAPVGTTIRADIGNSVRGSGIVGIAGEYGQNGYKMHVSEGENDNFDGDVIQFYVDGIQAQSSIFTNGASTELELSIEKEITTTTSGGGGGGGGGGSSGAAAYRATGNSVAQDTPDENVDVPMTGTSETAELAELSDVCTPNWVCSEWTECVNGFEKRKCIDANQCDVEDERPVENAQCEIKEDSFGTAFIGAFIGEGSRTGSILGIILLVAIALGATMFVQRKAKK